ncbi:DNA recombination protein RmuC [Rickettsiales endosymbiont of Peranema trichophorum]|uniref:DNA recombination protein RmuC n=1 Tax=Rickettsiales endosymbiont of Peranema trichophorum TaxID=2486577 RepID=UPI0010234E5A|nr:DNA recombination protein RmuC [Rickettsiales endosymbiont of Peranema trichophorum]RZI46362.1 DNA recombination protein RmuC [Rickettsiales endosymbiont of Peranema trichophorum]
MFPIMLIAAAVLLVFLLFVVILQRYKHHKIQLYQLSADHANLKEGLYQNFTQLQEMIRGECMSLSSSMSGQLQNISSMQRDQLTIFGNQISELTRLNEMKFETLRQTLDNNLQRLQNNTTSQLDKIRSTVEEKLHETLEKKLDASFQIVSDRLEAVYKSLGEMQTLAHGVGDLKKIFSNIKVRGTWGEVQLETLIAQILTPTQYSKNVQIRPSSNDRVEYAIKLPGSDINSNIWLPIDAKFPLEDFQRLLEVQERGVTSEIDAQRKAFESKIKLCARTISEKYVHPPITTDFAIMFLPIESLYAEVLKINGLIEFLQREYRIVITCPTTFLAILNSLQMGFRTLAIQRHSQEICHILEAIKYEFAKFADALGRMKVKIEQAGKEIDNAEAKTRLIQKKLDDAGNIGMLTHQE